MLWQNSTEEGVAAVLAADAQAQVGTGGAAIGGSHLDQLAHADLIQVLERIALVDLVVVVSAQELGCVVTAEARRSSGSGRWCPKLKNSASLAISPGGQSGARDLDHGADLVLHVDASLSDQLVGRSRPRHP